jgi:hypothetical protein
MALLERYLAALPTDEDRAATCSPGWRPRDWSPEARFATSEQDYRPHPRETPRWQSELDHRLDTIGEDYPAYLRAVVPRLWRQLSLEQRLILHLHCREGWSWRRIGRVFDAAGYPSLVHHMQVQRAHEQALLWLTERVWDATGAVRDAEVAC